MEPNFDDFCLIYENLCNIMNIRKKVTMTIIISPSKTMKPTSIHPKTQPMFKQQTNQIHNWLNGLSLKDLMNYYNVSETLATNTMNHIKLFGTMNYSAIYSYQGTQYHYIDMNSYSQSELTYIEKNVMILSGMYGLLRAFDGISLYRMPMHLSFQGESLYTFWKLSIKEYLGTQEVINLCSDEYGVLLQKELKNTTSIVFYLDSTCKRKAPSMEAKMMRGLMLKEIIHHQLKSKEMIKKIKVGGYSYNISHSTDEIYAFVKQHLDV